MGDEAAGSKAKNDAAFLSRMQRGWRRLEVERGC